MAAGGQGVLQVGGIALLPRWPSAPPCAHPGRARSLTSSASLPGDTGQLQAVRYVRLGAVARLSCPEGKAGDIALALALTQAIASPDYPVNEAAVRRMAERDEVSGARDTAAQSRQAGAKWHGGPMSAIRVPALVLHGAKDPLLRPAAAPPPRSPMRGWSSCPASGTTGPTRCIRRSPARSGRWPTAPAERSLAA